MRRNSWDYSQLKEGNIPGTHQVLPVTIKWYIIYFFCQYIIPSVYLLSLWHRTITFKHIKRIETWGHRLPAYVSVVGSFRQPTNYWRLTVTSSLRSHSGTLKILIPRSGENSDVALPIVGSLVCRHLEQRLVCVCPCGHPSGKHS